MQQDFPIALMPELPEVETIARQLCRVFAHQKIVSVLIRRSNLRRPFPQQMAERIAGNRIDTIRRRGKYMLASLSSDETLIIHLGMSGIFRFVPSNSDQDPNFMCGPHDHVVFVLENTWQAIYRDPRRFGLMDLVPSAEADSHPLIAPLGVEPFSANFDADYLASALRDRQGPIKSALLDQRLIAGLGNIYACESLWRAGISPRRRCNRIAFHRIVRLVDCIQAVLHEAIAAGGSTLRDHKLPDGARGYFQHHFQVYAQDGESCPNPKCCGKITKIVQSGRSSFYCRLCQK